MAGARYASETSVPVENSRGEIERTLRRYKADAFGYSTDGARATVAFRIQGRSVRFLLQMPDPQEREFTHHSRGPRETATRGGRHVEFGMALALRKRVIVVGFRENVFHTLPEVEFFDNWVECVRAIALEREAA